MRCSKPKVRSSKAHSKPHKMLTLSGEEDAAAAAAPHVAAVQLGIKLLVVSFDVNHSIRESLLREVQGKLVGVKEEVALPFVAVLGILVHRHPKAVLQHASLLKVSMHDTTVLWHAYVNTCQLASLHHATCR